jgi:hypothetical protein
VHADLAVPELTDTVCRSWSVSKLQLECLVQPIVCSILPFRRLCLFQSRLRSRPVACAPGGTELSLKSRLVAIRRKLLMPAQCPPPPDRNDLVVFSPSGHRRSSPSIWERCLTKRISSGLTITLGKRWYRT